jgi:hypothetical protein
MRAIFLFVLLRRPSVAGSDGTLAGMAEFALLVLYLRVPIG